MTGDVHVSILIPAYNEAYFAEALASALAQTHGDLEIVVCDDSPGTFIEQTCRAAADPRVRYLRNPERRGFGANFSHCLAQARGPLIKFLNDDDRLRPRCVEVLAAALDRHPQATLATSRRALIDAQGRGLRDILATTIVSHVSGVLSGRGLGDLVLANAENFIGEPTTVVFRREALPLEGDTLFRWGGREFHCTADLSVWLRLLARGDAYYTPEVLSEYRYHAGQEQYKKGVRVGCMTERLAIVRLARAQGFLAAAELMHTALKSLRTRAEPWATWTELDDAERAEIRVLLSEIDRELASAGTPPPVYK